MSETPNLDLPHFEAGISEPDVPVNALADGLDYAMNSHLLINFASDADYTLSTTGSVPQEWQNGTLEFTDSGVVLTTGRNVIVPDNERYYKVKNGTAQELTVKTSAGTGIAIPAGENGQLQCDGTNVIDIGAGSSSDTTYSISAETVSGGANLRLTDSDAGTDDVKFAEGTGVTIVRTDANTITITATGSASVLDMPTSSKTANYTVVSGDQGYLIKADATSGAITITLPAAATAGDGFTIAVKKMDSSNNVVIDGDGSETIDGALTYTLSTQYDAVFIQCDGSNWNILTEPASGATDTNAIHKSTNSEISAVTAKATLDPDDYFLIEDSEASNAKKSVTYADIMQVEENAQTGTSYTLVADDAFKIVTMTNASASTLTVPPNSSVAFPVGTQIIVTQQGAGQVTLTEGSGVTINAPDSTLTLRVQYSSVSLIKMDTNEWLAAGDLG